MPHGNDEIMFELFFIKFGSLVFPLIHFIRATMGILPINYNFSERDDDDVKEWNNNTNSICQLRLVV